MGELPIPGRKSRAIQDRDDAATNAGILWRMTRLRRLRLSGRIFFVTANLRRGLPHLTSQEYILILKSFNEARQPLDFYLCAYVLMPDHWHALIWPAEDSTIAQVMQSIKQRAARSLNRYRHASGPVWQPAYWDRFVRHAAEYRERIRYIHENPVRKGLVATPADWRWSSFNSFSLDEAARTACPIEVDHVVLPESYRGCHTATIQP